MGRSCCARPITRIIKVGDLEAGIIGLDQAFEKVRALRDQDEQQVKDSLVKLVKESGNYIAVSRESEYEEALFREYTKHKKRFPNLNTR
jgi:hypothetical protein